MKIVVLDGYTLAADGNSWDALRALGNVEVHDRSSPDELAVRARGASVLITNKARIPAKVIDNSRELRFIAVSATGFDCVDVAAASRRGIPVSNVPEYGTDSVAQFTFALLLELCHHVDRHAHAVRGGEWARSPDFCFWKAPLIELAGKTMGSEGGSPAGLPRPRGAQFRTSMRTGLLSAAAGVLARTRAMVAASCSPSGLPRHFRSGRFS
jgi:glycerate dehydrogenase